MHTWNRRTDLRGEGVGELEEISRRTYMHICMAHGHRQPCSEGQGGSGGRVEAGQSGGCEWGTSVMVSTIKK